MSSILAIYYSYTGTSRRLAQRLAASQGWPRGEIRDARLRSGFLGGLRCCFDALLRRQPRIDYTGPDPHDFEVVVLVGPVWMGRLAAPLRSFVAARRHQLPDVALLCTIRGGGVEGAVRELESLLGHRCLRSAAFTADDLDRPATAARLQAFAEGLREARELPSPGVTAQAAMRAS